MSDLTPTQGDIKFAMGCALLGLSPGDGMMKTFWAAQVAFEMINEQGLLEEFNDRVLLAHNRVQKAQNQLREGKPNAADGQGNDPAKDHQKYQEELDK